MTAAPGRFASIVEDLRRNARRMRQQAVIMRRHPKSYTEDDAQFEEQAADTADRAAAVLEAAP
jgi:hypothetical protein